MARREKTVEINYIDTEFSSGDCKQMRTKHYQEENNNVVDELSKELSEMGCIVDAAKRPPNICVETCVYEESESENEKTEVYNEEDAYSDEFEEDKSEEEESVKSLPKSVMSDTSREPTNRSSMKLTKSQSSIASHNKPPGSVSGRSTSFGSVSGLKTRRINMSFTNERLREIERHNHILLTKILSARNTRKCSIPSREQEARKPVPSAAVCRKNQQRQIDHDNMILLKKIQRAKSSACSIRR
ncbi:uncharacterized protein LOC111354392 [Spodoptera litura]|uniref:Uncharacterized protein LOC111354392 n=1 Tax=Spodoptera litura TaxID=69820 RepID=A0A9J7E7C6_SPOLT|nr:uncharacterized protein LOC111354392 [Spodoptera litura]XP_022823602.1 uncharacterized protein LOC111354392 [Spodoptera litura]